MKNPPSMMSFRRSAPVLILALASLASCAGKPAARPETVGAYHPSGLLPFAPELSRQTLPNGLTSYVRANGNPGNRVVLYLVVGVASSSEEDGERGYAHFIEHMAFNGTAGFPKNELVAYLRSIGMEFGAEVNAYTAREETVYTLTMPSDDPALFDKGLEVLEQWARSIAFDPAEVEKEKGVILEERRLGLGPDEKARRRETSVMLEGTRHADREPIGTEESVGNATAGRLRAFYERHYRPERMAVIVVGDIARDAANAKVAERFSFPGRDGKRSPRPSWPVKPSDKLSFASSFDPDFEQSTIFFEKIVPYDPEKTIGDYVELLYDRIATEAIRTRLGDLTKRGNRSWSNAGFDSDYFYGGTRLYAFVVTARTGSEVSAFSDLAEETERIRRYGFTDSEFKRVVDSWRRWIRSLDVEDNDLTSYSFADEYMRNFLYGEPVPGVAIERVYMTEALDALTPAILGNRASAILETGKGFVAIRAKEDVSNASLVKETFDSVLAGASRAPIGPLAPETSTGDLDLNLPDGAATVSELALGNGIEELTLSNGARVLLKPTSFDRGSVFFAAISPGGFADMPPEDEYAAYFTDTLLGAAGLGAMNAGRVEELLAGSEAEASFVISETNEQITGGCATEELETLLKLVYLGSADPGRDSAGFDRLRDRIVSQVDQYVKDPGYRFQTAWNAIVFGGHPRTAPLDAGRVAGLDFSRTRAVRLARFADASDFTYILVGDFAESEAKRLVAKYLGAIPRGERRPPEYADPMLPAKGGKDRTFAFAKEERASVEVVYAAAMPWSWERDTTLTLLASALENELLDDLREALGGTYSVNCQASFNSLPEPYAMLLVSFDCAPGRARELSDAVRKVLSDAAAGKLPAMYAEQAAAAADRDESNMVNTNRYWGTRLAYSVANGLDFGLEARARRMRDLAAPGSLAELAGELIRSENEFTFAMMPAGK